MHDLVIDKLVSKMIENGTAEEAMSLMQSLREGARRLDTLLGNPRHLWNSVSKESRRGDR